MSEIPHDNVSLFGVRAPDYGYFVMCLHPKSFVDGEIPYYIQSTRGCFRTYEEAQLYKGTIKPQWEPVIFSAEAVEKLSKEWYPKTWPPNNKGETVVSS